MLRILFVAAEAAPLAKAGGMGDVVGTLPKVLHQLGFDVRIFMPFYGTLASKVTLPAQPAWSGTVMEQPVAAYASALPNSDVPVYFLRHPAFDPARIYGGEDEDWRFTLFAGAATAFARNYWQPHVIHCHDWHTGMIPVWLHETPEIATVFTVHNLAYKGPDRVRLESITDCPPYMEGDTAMAAALMFADRVNAVSPTYARQIQTAAYGEGMEGLLSYIGDKLVGIVNGIDPEVFDPATDTYIPQTYTAKTLGDRARNKAALQQEFGLTRAPGAFVIGMVSRLVEQKGLDLILQVVPPLLSYTEAQVAILGTGDPYYEGQLRDLGTRFSGRMSVQLMYDETRSRLVYAGSDAFMMPSRFEPCGISQMIAMRYGCVPVVRRTGGLVDTVSHHDPVANTGTGYCFDRYEPLDFYTALVRASEAHRFPDSWQRLQQRGMARDFSWERSATAYAEIYRELTGRTAGEAVPASTTNGDAHDGKVAVRQPKRKKKWFGLFG